MPEVIEAAGITLAVAIRNYAKGSGLTEAQAKEYGNMVCGNVARAVERARELGAVPRNLRIRPN